MIPELFDSQPGLSIEPTSRCTLGCPRCGRTMLIEKFGKKAMPIVDLDPVLLDNFVDLKLSEVFMCGNYGDPIYHRNFKELIQVCKKHAKRITIVTNGGHRSKKWWEEIVELFGKNDKIVFSIDGTPENFTKYRINGDWASTLIGINECVNSKAKTMWKYIPFSFNENTIEDARKLSIDLGIDEFYIRTSDRWEKNDSLRPNNNDLSRQSSDFKEKYKDDRLSNSVALDPDCKTNQFHFINANGYYMPCCMLSDWRFYYKSQWWKNKEKHNIRTTKLSDQITNFNDFYKKLSIVKPDYCVFNCGKCSEETR